MEWGQVVAIEVLVGAVAVAAIDVVIIITLFLVLCDLESLLFINW